MDGVPLGNKARFAVEFTDPATEDPIDPTTVNVAVRRPEAGNQLTTYTYPTNTEVVKDSTGNYHIDVDLDIPGWYHVRWFSTGTGKAAPEETKLFVKNAVAIAGGKV